MSGYTVSHHFHAALRLALNSIRRRLSDATEAKRGPIVAFKFGSARVTRLELLGLGIRDPELLHVATDERALDTISLDGSSLPSRLPRRKALDGDDADDGGNGEAKGGRKPLAERRALDLREDEDGQPGGDGVLEAVHGADGQGPLLVVVGADLVGPGVAVHRGFVSARYGCGRWSRARNEDLQYGCHELDSACQKGEFLELDTRWPESQDTRRQKPKDLCHASSAVEYLGAWRRCRGDSREGQRQRRTESLCNQIGTPTDRVLVYSRWAVFE